jgi:hypothetical protein
MKNIVKIIALYSLSLFNQTIAQSLFKGAGIFGSLTQSAHRYVNKDTGKKPQDTSYKNPEYFYPQSHVSQEFLNWGAGAFLELSRRDNLRWQTEVEYINVGAKERALTNPFTGDRAAGTSTNKYTYIEWNNYLKFYYPLGVAYWYFMPGIRLQYLFKRAVTTFAPAANLSTFWFSGDIALGYEYPIYKNYSLFSEYHYNPDIIAFTSGNTTVRNRTLELRVGVVYRPRKRRIDDCNAPKYKGPNY